MQGSGGCAPSADKVKAFKSMQSNEIRHNLAINIMMTVGVALTLLKTPELWMQDDLLCKGAVSLTTTIKTLAFMPTCNQ